MIVISDTNILSSLAAGDSLYLLFLLFPSSQISIPPAVLDELQAGLAHGHTHVESVLQEIANNKIKVLPLSREEEHFSKSLPTKLNAGECEAIALSQNRKARLLSNDKRAVRYCHKQGVLVVDLSDMLRLLWIRNIISKREVEMLIDKMAKVEKIILSKTQRATIFAARC